MSPECRRPDPLKLLDPREVASLWADRFGIPEEILLPMAFYRRGKMVWAFSGSNLPELRAETVGLRAMSFKDGRWKPTTYALQIWGRHATKNVIDLGDHLAGMFMAGNGLSIVGDVEDGYVVVRWRGAVLGCGLYTRGTLICQLPKERRIKEDSPGDDGEDIP